MTGYELRQQVCSIINAWIGATKGSAKHQEILSIYNSYTPLARGYKVQTYDAYCATTVSAAWIKAGIAAYTGTECGVGAFIAVAQGKGIWQENDGYVPKIGDAVCYDWSDSGVGDNRGYGDHIGIVTQVNGSASFVVTEGNMSGGRTGQRTMEVNGRYIRGFITPDYDKIAAELGGTPGGTMAAAATPGKQLKVYNPWKTYRNGSTPETVHKDTDRTTQTGSLNPGEECWCTGRYGGSYCVIYKIDGTDDNYAVGYVAYNGGIAE